MVHDAPLSPSTKMLFVSSCSANLESDTILLICQRNRWGENVNIIYKFLPSLSKLYYREKLIMLKEKLVMILKSCATTSLSKRWLLRISSAAGTERDFDEHVITSVPIWISYLSLFEWYTGHCCDTCESLVSGMWYTLKVVHLILNRFQFSRNKFPAFDY